MAIGRTLFTGSNGGFIAPQVYVDDQLGLDAYLDVLMAVSVGLNVSNRLTSVTPGRGPGVGGTGYQTTADAAVLRFRNSTSGGQATIVIPQPADAIFLADTKTIDPTAIAGFIFTVQTYCRTPFGDPVDTFVAGQRRFLPIRQ